MNKLLIVLLAICLVNVHAFVKRDADTTKPDVFKELGEFGDKVLTTIKDAADPEKIKKDFNNFVDKMHGALEQLNQKPAEAKA